MSILDVFKEKNPNEELSGQNKRWIRRIQSVLSMDLLKPDYRKDLKPEDIVCMVYGHCYVATEAAYHLFAKSEGFVPYMAKIGDSTHWWLANEQTGEILDPTFPQLKGNFEIYAEGRRRAFLTKKPSKRAQEVIRRLMAQTQ